MPELPEVETVRKGLADRLEGFYVSKINVCLPRCIASPGGADRFARMLSGVQVGKWSRRGKYLMSALHKASDPTYLKQLEDAGTWGVHLRMTGQFQWISEPTDPCAHTRVRMWNERGEELRFVDIRSFGQMWWVPPGENPEKIITGLQKLGPEPFSKKFNSAYLRKKLKNSKRSIKSALLDQSIVAGAGNIYADESLFDAGIKPHTPAGNLNTERLANLCQSLVKVLTISIGKGGTTFKDFRDLKGSNGKYGGQAWVYRRNGQPCRTCGSVIKKCVLSGRSTHWCQICQT